MLSYTYSVHELGIQVEQVAAWEDSQGWMFTIDDESDILSVDILRVTIDREDSEYRVLAE